MSARLSRRQCTKNRSENVVSISESKHRVAPLLPTSCTSKVIQGFVLENLVYSCALLIQHPPDQCFSGTFDPITLWSYQCGNPSGFPLLPALAARMH